MVGEPTKPLSMPLATCTRYPQKRFSVSVRSRATNLVSTVEYEAIDLMEVYDLIKRNFPKCIVVRVIEL